jgi:hypothetical protein
VLRPEGSLFVNLGDKYSSFTGPNWGHGRNIGGGRRGQPRVPAGGPKAAPSLIGVPNKSLIGLPWRYALSCMGATPALADPAVVKILLRDVALGVITLAEAEQLADDLAAYPASGLRLILRAEIIWAKLAGAPESAGDRAHRGHEQMFHFVKQQRYFAAGHDIREPHTMRPQRRPRGHKTRQPLGMLPAQTYSTSQRDQPGVDGHPLGKLPGSVWQIAPAAPLRVPERIGHARCCGGRKRPGCEDGLDHHATFPPALARKVILGWSPPGICTECGTGRFPVTAAEPVRLRRRGRAGRATRNPEPGCDIDEDAAAPRPGRSAIIGNACDCTPYTDHAGYGQRDQSLTRRGSGKPGWHPDDHGPMPATGPWREYHVQDWTPPPTRPAVVLDPFAGTGTTPLVAAALGRVGIGGDRSADYCHLARWRTTDPGEIARALGLPRPPTQSAGQAALFDLVAR